MIKETIKIMVLGDLTALTILSILKLDNILLNEKTKMPSLKFHNNEFSSIESYNNHRHYNKFQSVSRLY